MEKKLKLFNMEAALDMRTGGLFATSERLHKKTNRQRTNMG